MHIRKFSLACVIFCFLTAIVGYIFSIFYITYIPNYNYDKLSFEARLNPVARGTTLNEMQPHNFVNINLVRAALRMHNCAFAILPHKICSVH